MFIEVSELTINSPPALDPDYPEVNGIAPLHPELNDPASIATTLHVPEANATPLMETNPSTPKPEDPALIEGWFLAAVLLVH